MEAFVKEVYNIAKSTVMDEIKAVVSHVRNFVDGVKHDILKFYNVSGVKCYLDVTGIIIPSNCSI